MIHCFILYYFLDDKLTTKYYNNTDYYDDEPYQNGKSKAVILFIPIWLKPCHNNEHKMSLYFYSKEIYAQKGVR